MNTGVQINVLDTDFRVGGVTGLIYKENTDGNWLPYLPTEENQFGNLGDKMNCVTHSYHNCVETYMNWMIQTKRMPETHLKFLKDNGYLDAAGKVNFNERISAILNGTTKNGNSLNTVAQIARNVGLFPEGLLPNDHNLSWDEYYDKTKITPEMLAIGKKFLEYFELPSEWVLTGANQMNETVISQLKQHLKQAPLQIAAPWCPSWGKGVDVAPCGRLETDHATILAQYDTQPVIFDHYRPYLKTLKTDYPIPYVLKVIVEPITTVKPIPYLPYYEKIEGQPAISVYDPDTDTMIAFESGRLFKALYCDYSKVKIKTVKKWSRPLKELITTKPI